MEARSLYWWSPSPKLWVKRSVLSLLVSDFTLSKSERLSSRKAIDRLFKEGRSLAKYPIRLVWIPATKTDDSPFQVLVMFSVSKKKFARAVDRNRIKRLMREAYRLRKPVLPDDLSGGQQYHLALMYTGSEILDLVSIQKSLATALERWMNEINSDRSNSTKSASV